MPKSVRYDDLISTKVASYDTVGKVSSKSVEKHTGKDWKAWITILDDIGARGMTHQEIVALLKKRFGLTPWWQQGVALGFEIAIGRRRIGQDARGKYMVTATKSLAAEVKAIWKLLVSPKGLNLWLQPLSKIRMAPKTPFETRDGFFGEVRTIAEDRRIRMFWENSDWASRTVVEVQLVPRPGKKSILVINHTGIPDDATRLKLKTRWREAVDSLGEAIA